MQERKALAGQGAVKRGGYLETQLDFRHREYRRDRLAWVAHAHPEAKIVDGDLIFSKKGPPDYFGIVAPSRPVLFDAKETGRASFPFGGLSPHQAMDLEAAMLAGGCCFLVLYFTKLSLYRLAPWEELGPMWWAWAEKTSKTASVRHDDPILVPMEGADWLSAIR